LATGLPAGLLTDFLTAFLLRATAISNVLHAVGFADIDYIINKNNYL
jgi:hypothetical protein